MAMARDVVKRKAAEIFMHEAYGAGDARIRWPAQVGSVDLAALAPRGRLVLLGFLAGSRTTTDLGPILRKRLEVVGTGSKHKVSTSESGRLYCFASASNDGGEILVGTDSVVV